MAEPAVATHNATNTGSRAKPNETLTDKQKKVLAYIGAAAGVVTILAFTRKPSTAGAYPVSGVPGTTGTTTGVAPAPPTGTQPTVGIVPGTPTSLTQVGSTNSSITLEWSPVSNAVNYLLYDYTTNLLIGQSSTNSITVNNLQANTHYTWYVVAQSADGSLSQPSQPITVTTSSNVQVATVPNVPAALVVTGTTDTSVSFSWAPVTGATYYQITTQPPGATGGGQVLSNITGTTATVSGLSPNTQYQFSLQACNSVGCSNPSGLTMATTSTSTTTTTPTAVQLVSISISPSQATVTAGQTQQLTATGTNSDGSTTDVTSKATWSVQSQATATVNSTGLVTGVAVGATTVSACVGSICGYAVIAVQPQPTSTTPPQQGVQNPNNPSATITTLTVIPSSANIQQGQTQQFRATATYSDGHQQDATAQATWSSQNNSIASVSGGLVTANNIGQTQISACIGQICSYAGVNVTQSQQAIQQAAQRVAQQAAAAQQAALQAAQQRAAQYAATVEAQQIFYQQQQQHNAYAAAHNYGTPVNTQNTALPNSLVPGGASLQTISTYYNPSSNTYSYLTTNNLGGYQNGQYVPVTTGVTNVAPGQSTTLMGSQCMPGTLNGKSGSWDGYGNFHPGCSDCSCPVGS